MDATEIIKSLSPLIGTIIGGPVGGLVVPAATNWLADRLGLEHKTVEAVADAIQGMSPQERLTLEQDFAKWQAEFSLKQDQMYIADTQDARARDVGLAKSGQRNYRADFMFALAVVVIMIVFYAIWSTPGINEYVKGVSTLILGRFLGYLDNIYNFEFGTTRSSQTKDNTINNLTKG